MGITPKIDPIYNHYIIDMSSNNNFVQNPTMQGDGNYVRGIEIELISNGTQYVVDKNNTIVSIAGTKPDTKQILNDCEVTDEGYILVDITSQMSAVKGRGDYCIVLMDKTTNSQLKSFPFYIMTTSAPFNVSEIVSSDEFQLLTKTVVDAGVASLEAQKQLEEMRELESEVSANEEIRIANENQRISNENNRESAEAERETDSATAVSNANTAAQNANEATQDAIDTIATANTAISNVNTATQNANTVIAEMEALMANDNLVHKSEMGVAGGVASLDENGNIPSSQLPSFVDDVLDGTYDAENEQFLDLEGNVYTPTSGKIYIDVNKRITYRWSGTTFVDIGSSLSLGVTSSTAYPGDRGLALEERVTDIEEYHNNIPAKDIKFDNTDTTLLGANVQDVLVELTETATTTKNGLLSAEDKKTIDTYKNIYTYETTLLSSRWTGSSAPYTQILTISELSGYNNCNVVLDNTATPEQEIAATNAEITSITYNESVGFTFTASGIKPSVDIPIVFKFGASMTVSEVPKYLGSLNEGISISFDTSTSNDITSDNLQGAINQVNNKIGLLSQLTTGVKTSIVNALNWIVGKLGNVDDISAIGDGTVSGAITSLNSNLGGYGFAKASCSASGLGFSISTTVRIITSAFDSYPSAGDGSVTAQANGVKVNVSGYYDVNEYVLAYAADNRIRLGVRFYRESDDYSDSTLFVMGENGTHLKYESNATYIEAGTLIRPICYGVDSASGTISTLNLNVIKRYTGE